MKKPKHIFEDFCRWCKKPLTHRTLKHGRTVKICIKTECLERWADERRQQQMDRDIAEND